MSAQTHVSLRPVTYQDVATFWAHQQLTRPDTDALAQQAAFIARWRKTLNAADVATRAIVADGQVVGYVAHFQRKDLPEVSYELGKPHWGKGFATAALREFLGEVQVRPLYARAAKDNAASMRVLEKCGFAIVGEDRFSDAAGDEREEFVFQLCR